MSHLWIKVGILSSILMGLTTCKMECTAPKKDVAAEKTATAQTATAQNTQKEVQKSVSKESAADSSSEEETTTEIERESQEQHNVEMDASIPSDGTFGDVKSEVNIVGSRSEPLAKEDAAPSDLAGTKWVFEDKGGVGFTLQIEDKRLIMVVNCFASKSKIVASGDPIKIPVILDGKKAWFVDLQSVEAKVKSMDNPEARCRIKIEAPYFDFSKASEGILKVGGGVSLKTLTKQ